MTICEFNTDGAAMRIKMPVSARYPTWHRDCASQTSPFSIGQQDPGVSETLGRRVWGLLLAAPPESWRERGGAGVEAFRRMRNWYGVIGLDRYKDFVLEWEDAEVDYPRVFQRPENFERFRAFIEFTSFAFSVKP